MSTVHMTPTAQLLDMRLRESTGEELVDAVIRLASEGQAFRAIALHLRDATGIRVSHETVRLWHAEWSHDGAAA